MTLRFLDVGKWIEPLGPFDANNPTKLNRNLHLTDPTSFVRLQDANQAVCGYLFMELWANDR
jgi:hypothetical protein